MDIEFDPAKDASNKAKHGISLVQAARLDWDGLHIEPDLRHDYGEDRFTGTGWLNERLYVVIFTRRADATRVISLRKANPREIEYYENQG